MSEKDSCDNETLLEFPCEFPIKAFGKGDNDFDAVVVEIVRRHVSDLKEGSVKSHDSKKGKFVAVTITITATSKAQIDAIYMDLTACTDVLMAL